MGGGGGGGGREREREVWEEREGGGCGEEGGRREWEGEEGKGIGGKRMKEERGKEWVEMVELLTCSDVSSHLSFSLELDPAQSLSEQVFPEGSQTQRRPRKGQGAPLP